MTVALKSAYENVDNVRDFRKKLMAIALMPIADVEDCYTELFPDEDILNSINNLMGYYNHEWLDVIGKEMYCVYNLDWRTNNKCEGLDNYEFWMLEQVESHTKVNIVWVF